MNEADPKVSVGASDSLIFAVAMTGFTVLAGTIYVLLIRPSSAAAKDQDGPRGGGGVLTYDQLKQAKVTDLNRAQRRVRARTIAKEEAKSLTTTAVSKPERQRLQRDIEWRERHAAQEERDRLQQVQMKRAAMAKEQRDARKHQERTAQALAEFERWETFVKTDSQPNRIIRVTELVERLQRNRVLNIEALSLEFQNMEPERIVCRLNELVDDGRIAGVFVNNQKSFLYFSDHDLLKLAEEIEPKQKISYLEQILQSSTP
jgi:negative regulator of genetic competence, sporulation and motility